MSIELKQVAEQSLDLRTPTLREMVTRHAAVIDSRATLEDMPEALAFQIDMVRALLREFTAIQQAEAQQPATGEPVQADSSEHIRVIASLGAALRRLSFAAQTTGGTDGPDAELQSAIGQAEQALSLGGIWQAMSATGEPEDFPAGAIVNGRTLMERIEAYPFESQGGDLRMCSDWHELRRCFEHLADYVSPTQRRVCVLTWCACRCKS